MSTSTTTENWEPDEEMVETASIWFDKSPSAARTILKQLRRARGIELRRIDE